MLYKLCKFVVDHKRSVLIISFGVISGLGKMAINEILPITRKTQVEEFKMDFDIGDLPKPNFDDLIK